MISDAQVMLLRQKLSEGSTQEAAARAAQMSTRSARKWQQGALPSECKKPRNWRTRRDPLAGLWESEVVPLLEERWVRDVPTLLARLRNLRPEMPLTVHVRTLQRRIRQWRTLHVGG